MIRIKENESADCEKYGRLEVEVPLKTLVVEVMLPDGSKESVPTYSDQPAEFQFDCHGYETLSAAGDVRRCFRYTPRAEGDYSWRDAHDEVIGGTFHCSASNQPGYVGVSKKDPRYFAFTSGASYVPIGPNACLLRYDALPQSDEHFKTGDQFATLGMNSYRRWFSAMQRAGINYTRLWLSSAYLDARTKYPGRHNFLIFNRLDRIMELARAYGIRVKLCLEHFRFFGDNSSEYSKASFCKELWDERSHQPYRPEGGSLGDWLSSDYWNQKWQEDIMPYLARYQNDPVVFAWELWNEMDCVMAPYEKTLQFCSRMAAWVHRCSPHNMVTNSTGSFDWEGKRDAIKQMAELPELDFGQFHRYIDQGAKMDVCHTDAIDLVVDGVRQMACGSRPIILNETGAVNDCHTGPFRFYGIDYAGTILNDVTYAPFFAGAAGSGHSWHWEYYIDLHDLWQNYLPLVKLLENVQVDEEAFEPFEIGNDQVRILGLKGRHITLLYVRNKKDRWDYTLRDQCPIPSIQELDLPLCYSKAEVVGLHGDEHLSQQWSIAASHLTVSRFKHGFVAKMEL